MRAPLKYALHLRLWSAHAPYLSTLPAAFLADWCDLQTAVAVPGRTVLIFLPGKREIEQMLYMFQVELAPAFGSDGRPPKGGSSRGTPPSAAFMDGEPEGSGGEASPAALLPTYGTITFGVLHSEVPQDIQRATLLPPDAVRRPTNAPRLTSPHPHRACVTPRCLVCACRR